MSSQPLQINPSSVSQSDVLFFAGDEVRLAGQMDYPVTPVPASGYPLVFVIPHATCTTRHGFMHYARLGTEYGVAVFRWDKRGTGNSGSGGTGTGLQDMLNAYQTALAQKDVDRTQTMIIAQNEGTLMLSEAIGDVLALQKPVGVVLAGNMLDEKQILSIKAPVLSIVSKNDWNAWQIYAEAAVKSHNKALRMNSQYYVAPGTNRRLMLEPGNSFHAGAANMLKDWLLKLLPSAVRPTSSTSA